VKPRLAIDLGSRELKMLEADGRRLTRHTEVLLPDGALADGVPTPLLTVAVRGALEEGGFVATTARVAISEMGTAFRDFALPRIPASELSSAVSFEGRRLIPMEPSDVYFAWSAERDGDGYAVYLVAARRAMIDGVVEALSAAGVQVERIDLKPLALARGMAVSDGLLLDWGAGEATLVLMARGRARFFRSFQLDSPSENGEAQLEELAFALEALVKFMRTAAPEISIGPATPLVLGGRFAFLPDGVVLARQRFPFQVRLPSLRLKAGPSLPWQAHLAGIGLLQSIHWRERITPSQGGDNRVAA